MNMLGPKKWATVALACVVSLSLSGCLILPGQFVSEMTVRRSGDFSFSYKGQIQLLGLANLLNNTLDEAKGAGEFTATCWKEQPDTDDAADVPDDAKAEKTKAKARTESAENAAALAVMRGESKGSAASSTADEDFAAVQDEAAEAIEDASVATEAASNAASDWQMEERECTAAEITEQKRDWEEQQAATKKTEEEQKKMFAMLLGGINPEDPDTIKRFTKEVERLAAWHKVEHLGNGLFMIDYSTSGKLADDFAFPVIPRYAIGEPMIHITRWDNGRLRVEAPAFRTDQDLSVMAMMGMGGFGGGRKPAEPVAVKGTFTLTTDARIVANNTEEGPETVSGMDVLRWDVGAASYGAPMALLKLAQ